MKKRKLLSQMTTEEIVERAIKRFAANDKKVGCSECKKNGGHGCRNCDPVLAKAGMSLRSFSARSGKSAEEIKRLDYCREGLRRMRLGQTKKKINTKAKNLEKKKNNEKEKEGEETRNQSSSGASTSTSCSADAIAEGVNTSAAAAALQAKEEEEEENDATIADEACREDAAMALMSIAKAVTPA